MRKANISITERTLMFAVGGQLFDQAPNRQPRNVEALMLKVRDAFRKVAYNDNEYYTLVVEENKLTEFLRNLLMGIQEFKDLNLSQNEYENNVSVDDENRPEFAFSSRYDRYDSESWRSGFIDLDAFIRNVVSNIYMLEDYNKDCFCCVNQDTDVCNTCCVNPKFEVKYKGSRKPKGKYTFACIHDCYKNKYICCEECDDKDSCPDSCDNDSQRCGLAINHINK